MSFVDTARHETLAEHQARLVRSGWRPLDRAEALTVFSAAEVAAHFDRPLLPPSDWTASYGKTTTEICFRGRPVLTLPSNATVGEAALAGLRAGLALAGQRIEDRAR